MPPKAKSVSHQSSATSGFEAAALRGSANPQRAAILRSPQGNRWPTADSRSAAETAEGNRSNSMDAAEPSGARQIAKGNPQSERGGVHQFGVPPESNASSA